MTGRLFNVISHLKRTGTIGILSSVVINYRSFHIITAESAKYDYDFAVIGGGSGGLSAAKAAAQNGAKVVVFDYVEPTSHGTSWGLGGTCVNVGCIPKKLMHAASLHGETMETDVSHFGWTLNGTKSFNWSTLVENVNDFIKSVNFAYRTDLRKNNATYINGFARFKDNHTLEYVDNRGKEGSVTADKVLIAIGGRPNELKVPGAEYAITSDDIFQLEREPGKTLVIGAGYVALECAGFLTGIGYEANVLIRSIPLRGFDQQMAGKIVEYMNWRGTKFAHGQIKSIEKVDEHTYKTTWHSDDDGQEHHDTYNTILFAAGRHPVTHKLGLENTEVKLSSATNKIIVNEHDQTSVDNIYCVGDCAEGIPELTPVAVQAGKLLGERLYGGRTKLMNYNLVATTVFTPIEYGTIGYSEEAAIAKFGDENIEVYHFQASPYEQVIVDERGNYCAYMKLIVNKLDNERVIGFHITAPNAGEITQGFALALNLGATKTDFDDTVGIHPTTAELFTTMTITKRSGQPLPKGGCPSCS